MNRQEQIEACERFMAGEFRAEWMGDYNPFADTPEGREQANELWKKLDGIDELYASIENSCHNKAMWTCKIVAVVNRHLWKTRKIDTIWNSALSAAVAELQVALEAENE